MSDDDARMKAGEKAADQLIEHFDSVKVLVTWQEGGVTKEGEFSRGNWHASQSLMLERLLRGMTRVVIDELPDGPDPEEA